MPPYYLGGEELHLIHRAIEAGDKEAGITIMKIVNKLDAGPMIMKEKLSVSEEDTTDSLSKKLSDIRGIIDHYFTKRY